MIPGLPELKELVFFKIFLQIAPAGCQFNHLKVRAELFA
jgi:hypothetical protein